MAPDSLSDRDWAQKFQDWVYLTRIENEMLAVMIGNEIRKVAVEVIEAMYGKR
ncbi:MAG: hypothetical protein M9958_03210 [Chitinophagales bacterium]|nr:hypothetical protein [Chitinophagales bacterium]